MPVPPLSPKQLFLACDPRDLPFTTTAKLTDSSEPVGQSRAVEALHFAMGVKAEGYNLFALGPQGTGKQSLICRHLHKLAAEMPVPDDWVYVHNFAQPHQPRAIRLPHGRGKPFADAMAELVEDLQATLPGVFEGDDYTKRREALEDSLKERQEDAFSAIQEEATKDNVTLVRTPNGLAVAPLKEGEVINADDFQKLPEDEQKHLQAAMGDIQQKMEQVMREVPKWEKEIREKLRTLDQEVTEKTVIQHMEDIRKAYKDLPEIQAYLDDVAEDVRTNVSDFLPQETDGAEDPAQAAMMRRLMPGGEAALRRYRVNNLVHHDNGGGAPVVIENHPVQPNLVGRIEHMQQYGALMTDFNLIKPGALHRANGGFLVIEARKLLLQPYAWEDLKRALTARKIHIESPGQTTGMFTTISLEPRPIPLSVKVVLLGEPMLYYMLAEHDPEFRELFKVAADFDFQMDRNSDNTLELARLIGTIARREDMLPLNRDAVARVIEHGARLAEDAHKLTTHMGSLADLVREAHYFAKQDGKKSIDRKHVQKALDAHTHRFDRVREHIQEEIEDGTILINTDGGAVGQINGLAVMQLGSFAFGRPSRITCRVRMGRGEFVDIEREVDLGGPLHTKGMMILSSFMASRFAEDTPLSLAATLVFEQSYGMVDGDSASSTELYALLSALADVELKQSYAVTGSVDQFGRVQAIGGVNEKIEGFFDLCVARGLSKDPKKRHGVVIPATNIKHLMLKESVVEACEKGLFAIHGVATIDEGIEVLTGLPAGVREDDGMFTPGSINRKVAARLASLHKRMRQLSGEAAAPANPGRRPPRAVSGAAENEGEE